MVSDQRSCGAGRRLRIQRRRLRPGARGLTLVELLVAIAISLFMIGALVVLYVSNSTARTELDRSSRQIENGRFAIDMMRDDIALAGYYGEINLRAENPAFVEANPCETNTANMGWSTNAVPLPLSAPVPVQGPSPSAPMASDTGCSSLNLRPDTGYLVVRRLRPELVAPAATIASTRYVQSAGCVDATLPFVLAGGGAANFTMTGPDCIAVKPVREYLSRLYFVSRCGVCSPDDGVPTLKMRELQGGAIVERVIADGIENLQFEFGFDTDGDGVVDNFATTGTAATWQNVVAVRVRLVSRATTTTPGYADDKTYDLGLFGTYTPAVADQQFKRRAYTALVQLPNVAGPRELP
jgi:type IV pilus assembly protein PilW